jgi:hypothetical protein
MAVYWRRRNEKRPSSIRQPAAVRTCSTNLINDLYIHEFLGPCTTDFQRPVIMNFVHQSAIVEAIQQRQKKKHIACQNIKFDSMIHHQVRSMVFACIRL